MALSGEVTLTTTLNEMLTEAYDLLQIGQDGETLNGDLLGRAKRTANMMIAEWEAQSTHLWVSKRGTLFPVVGQSLYDFSTARVTNEFFETELAAAASSGASTITVDSATSFASAMSIQVILDDNTGFWTTINGAPASNVITLTDVLTGDALINAKVRAYSDVLDPVMRIKTVRRRDSATQEAPVSFRSEDEFDLLSDKESSSDINQAHYNRDLETGQMRVWGVPNSAIPLLNFTYDRRLNIMSTNADSFDLPSYWHSAFCFNLANRLKLKFGCTPQRSQELTMFANETLTAALSFDTENYPIVIRPRIRRR